MARAHIHPGQRGFKICLELRMLCQTSTSFSTCSAIFLSDTSGFSSRCAWARITAFKEPTDTPAISLEIAGAVNDEVVGRACQERSFEAAPTKHPRAFFPGPQRSRVCAVGEFPIAKAAPVNWARLRVLRKIWNGGNRYHGQKKTQQ